MTGSDVTDSGVTDSDPGDPVDFVLAAYREEGRWQVDPLPPRSADDLDGLLGVLRGRSGDAGALGLVSVDEDFFLLLRVLGPRSRLLLSDVTAAAEWPIARAVLDHLDLPLPDGEELDEVQPAGDLGIVGDLGVDAMSLAAICDDLDAYPDELLGEVAERLGFGPAYGDALASIGQRPDLQT